MCIRDRSLGAFQSVKGATVIKRLIARVVETMDQEEPSVVLQIGLPVFGFKLLEIARARGIPVIYYYTPFSRGLAHMNQRQFLSLIHILREVVIPPSRPGLMNMLNRLKQQF